MSAGVESILGAFTDNLGAIQVHACIFYLDHVNS